MQPEQSTSLPVRRRPLRLRAALLAVGVVILLAAAAWSGLWLFTKSRAQAGLAQWIQAEAARGRDWTCPEQAVGGFPFAIRLHCTKPTFHGEIAGRISSGTMDALDAGVDFADAKTVVIRATGPMVLRADDDSYHMLASWEAVRIRLDARAAGPVRQGDLEATRLAVTIVPQDQADLNLRAAHLTGEAAPVAGNADAAWAFSASGVSFPTLDGFMGSQEPFAAQGRGQLVQAGLLSAPTAKRLEAWRQAGGRLEIASLNLTKGAFDGHASGTLALDEQHRPTGRLDTTLKGFGPVAQKLGIPIAGIRLGGILSSLLGGGQQPTGAPIGADALRLPLSLADGRLAVGVIQLPVRLDPFY